MKHLILLLALSAPLPSFAQEAETPATQIVEPSEAALTFVAGFSDDHLSGMLSRIGSRSPVLAGFAQIDGQVTSLTFDAEIDKAVKRHGAAWKRNMAIAWTPLLSEDELTSLTTAGAQSPHTDKYLELRGEAGLTMQSLSQQLFRDVLREVIDNTVAELTPKDAPAQ